MTELEQLKQDMDRLLERVVALEKRPLVPFELMRIGPRRLPQPAQLGEMDKVAIRSAMQQAFLSPGTAQPIDPPRAL